MTDERQKDEMLGLLVGLDMELGDEGWWSKDALLAFGAWLDKRQAWVRSGLTLWDEVV